MKRKQGGVHHGGDTIHLPEVVFSSWVSWNDRASLGGINLPGVYLLACFDMPPRGPANRQAQGIIYIGETCSNSLRGRWRQFQRSAFEEKSDHSGGVTYRDVFGDTAEGVRGRHSRSARHESSGPGSTGAR